MKFIKNKSTFMNSKLFAIALLVSSLAISTVSMASGGDRSKRVGELVMVDVVNNQPVFQLKMTNTEEYEYSVTFRHASGNILYTDKFRGTTISKKFLLKSEEITDDALNVVIKSKKKAATDEFIIKRTSQLVEETVVNKIR